MTQKVPFPKVGCKLQIAMQNIATLESIEGRRLSQEGDPTPMGGPASQRPCSSPTPSPIDNFLIPAQPPVEPEWWLESNRFFAFKGANMAWKWKGGNGPKRCCPRQTFGQKLNKRFDFFVCTLHMFFEFLQFPFLWHLIWHSSAGDPRWGPSTGLFPATQTFPASELHCSATPWSITFGCSLVSGGISFFKSRQS